LSPLQIEEIQKDPLAGMITFKTEPGIYEIKSWKLEIKDASGKVQKFGPFTSTSENISANLILGDNKTGDYTVEMIAKTTAGKDIRKEATFHLERSEDIILHSNRYSVLFDFDESLTNPDYVKFLDEVVAPQIAGNSKVIIHGYADGIGERDHNLQLSRDRALAAKNILAQAMTRAGKTGVVFEVYGVGEDPNHAPYSDKYPEEHFYNRTVIIDIVTK
jgi:outer membrane protein OmpA-like peptidoglycan-associated protein